MPYELILSTDTLNQGRVKINDFVNATSGVWSSDTTNYSIFSRIGPTNYNSSFGNYGFVAGVNNSAVTGNYSCITGGKTNYTRGSFNLVGNGVNNQIRNASSTYSSVLNGSANQIAITTLSKYSTVINGKNNKIYGGSYNILNGLGNQIYGDNNIIFGGNNKILKNSANPGRNLLVGSGLIVSGSNTVRDNIIIGINNRVVNTLPGASSPGGFMNYSSIVGGDNRIYRGGASTIHGIFLNNIGDLDSLPKTDLAMFGRGASTSSPLRPRNSYSMVMGSNAAGGRAVRIEFGGTPFAYLKSGSWQNSGADYGEYFEWADGNLNSEDRVGYFVAIENGKIKIANDINALGIVSKTTAFIGDANLDYWSEMNLMDEWGVIMKEKILEYTYEINGVSKNYYFDKDDNCFDCLPSPENPVKNFIQNIDKSNGLFSRELEIPLYNPNYDPSKKYISREFRNEWDVVGLLGKLRVRTSEQITGNFVDVDTNTGMAKNGTTYPVLKKFKDFDGNYGIVLIFFK